MRPENSVKKDGYLTLDNVPEARSCRAFSIPDDSGWLGTFMGAIEPLLTVEAWQEYGELTPAECADEWQRIFFSFEKECPDDSMVGTPYWDTDDDVDDDAAADEQTWYGYVTDPASQPTELDFVEDATIWAFTGLIVLSLGALGIAPALAFRTTATKFVVSYKNGGNIGDVIRFFVDGYKIYEGTDTGAGEITNVPVITDPDIEEHQIYATWEKSA